MMLSLIRPDAGEISISEKKLYEHRNEILKKIGCIIESPDFYLYLSAEKNLNCSENFTEVSRQKRKSMS